MLDFEAGQKPYDLFTHADAQEQHQIKQKADAGRTNYLSGQSAEVAVRKWYEVKGAEFLSQRYRGADGEIDLIFREGHEYVFVEVKASRTFERALARITPRQIARIYRAAEVFVGTRPEGTLAHMRFDAALVDQYGHIEVLKGSLLPY